MLQKLTQFSFLIAILFALGLFSEAAHAGCTTGANTVTCTSSTGASVTASNPTGSCTGACPTTVSSPAQITVTGGSGTVNSVTVTVSGYTGVLNTAASPAETGSRDMGMLLVSPTGRNLELMRCIGHPSSGGQSNLTLTFQNGATAMPSCDSGTSFTSGGTFEPSAYHTAANLTGETDPNYSTVISGSLNAAQTNGTATFSVFTGDSVNGAWSLYLAADPLEATNVNFSSWSITINFTAASTPSTTTLTANTPNDPTHVETGAAYTSGNNSTIVLTATVSGAAGTPTGTVTFQDVSNGGATNLACSGGNPATLSGGAATCSTTISTQGYRSLLASYSGNSTYVASSGNAAAFLQNHATNTGTTYCNAGGVTGNGESAQSSWSPAGSVENMNPYPSVIFVGDGVNTDIANSVNTLSVQLNNFVVTSASSTATHLLLVSPSGQAFDFWDGVGISVINGSYTIEDGGAQMPDNASGTLPSGTYEPTAWLSSAFTPAPPAPAPKIPASIAVAEPSGSATFLGTFAGATAHGAWSLFVYNGEGSNTTTSLGSWCINITPATGTPTTTSLQATVSGSATQHAALGASVTLTATVSASSTVNQGTVTFTDTYTASGTTTTLGSSGVSNGTAVITASSLIEGDHVITATYQDGATFNDSVGTLQFRVDAATSAPTLNGSTWTYCNAAGITIPAKQNGIGGSDKGPAAPNPSNIVVTNLPGTIATVTLSLNGFHMTNGGNIVDSLLVGPNGASAPTTAQTLDFFSALTSNQGFGPSNYTFTDSGQSASLTCPAAFPAVPPTTLAPASCTASTSYTASPFYTLPTSFQHAATAGAFTFNTGARTGSGGGVYLDSNPNGAWSLYFNQTIPDTGSGATSWCLNFTENAVTVSVNEGHAGAGGPGSNFVQGEQNAQLTTVITNNGPGSTGDPSSGSHPLTVTDSLNSAFTYTSFSGTGWSCSANLQTVTCTNDSPVAQGSSYPTLTLNVNVATNAPASVTNSVSVIGAGATPTTSATDTITINAPPSLSVSKTHTGAFTQGSTAEWDVTVSNTAASGSTTGTTNLSDTLPSGYTLNSFSSTGNVWTCGSALNVVTCTSTQAVAGGTAFPTLRLIVNVPATSPTSVSNAARAWGGGDPVHISSATAAVSNTDTVSVAQVPASISATSGSGQSANVNTLFTNPLVVTVLDAGNQPVPNVTVTFTAPAQTGPSVIFAGGVNTATTNASGVATSAAITANNNAGGPYLVVAGVSSLTANFSLRNIGIPATVTSLTSTAANGSYTVGAVIPIAITFSKTVNVAGTPMLALNSGGTAAYASGSGTATLTFTYTVAAGQNSPALDALSTSSLSLNGGTITDSGATPANLTLPAPGFAGSLSANKSIVIDTTAPTVVTYFVDWGSETFNMATSTRNRLPWEITGITVVFSKPIAAANMSSLAGVTPTAVSGVGTNTLTWTIAPIAEGNFATTLAGGGASAIKDAAGNALTGGSGFSQALKVLWGDYNDDGVVNAADLTGVNNARTGTYNIFADLNGDGVVNTTDVAIVRSRLATSLP